LPELPERVRDKAKKRMALAERALQSLERHRVSHGEAGSYPASATAASPIAAGHAAG
jgi:hypothetical protein